MSWDWSSPIALGIFFIETAGAILLLGVAVAVAASSARWAGMSSRRRDR